MRALILSTALSALSAPAFAASGPFFSLRNTDFTVLIAFILFIGILLYAKIPARLGGLLDKRAAQIKADLEAARALREEAKALLASYERRQREVSEQAERIVANARTDALEAAAKAKEDLKQAIARRLQAAEEQIAAAEAAAVREVRERAVNVAIAASAELLARQMTADRANALVDASIAEVGAKLH